MEIFEIIKENLIQILLSASVIISVLLGKNKTAEQITKKKTKQLKKTRKKGLKSLEKASKYNQKAEELEKEIEKWLKPTKTTKNLN